MEEKNRIDSYAPREMAERVQDVGVAKANLNLWSLLALSVLAGAFIGLGAAFSTLATTGSALGYGPTRVLGGVTFSLGLILVLVGGAELFTGNLLIVMAWAGGRVSSGRLLRNWAGSFVGNFVGATATALLVYASGAWEAYGGEVAVTAVRIAAAKEQLGFGRAFALGVLCNALVCLAVWLTFSARSTMDKILSVLFPITAFVALGFEHSVANMYFIPLGILLQGHVAGAPTVTWAGLAGNLVPVTLGNMVGGGLLVATTYWFIYLRGHRHPPASQGKGAEDVEKK